MAGGGGQGFLQSTWCMARDEGSANQLGRFTVVTMNKAHRALAFMTSSEKQHYVPMQQSKEQWHATVTVEPVEHQSPIFWAACLHACRSSMRIRAVLAKNWCWIFLPDGLPAQNPSIWRRILWTHSMHSSSHHVFHYDACLVLCLLAFLCTLSEHTHNAHNQSTPSRCCEQLSLHFPQKRRNGSGSAALTIPSNRRCFQHPHFVGQLQSASAVLPSQCIHGATLNADTSWSTE